MNLKEKIKDINNPVLEGCKHEITDDDIGYSVQGVNVPYRDPWISTGWYCCIKCGALVLFNTEDLNNTFPYVKKDK